MHGFYCKHQDPCNVGCDKKYFSFCLYFLLDNTVVFPSCIQWGLWKYCKGISVYNAVRVSTIQSTMQLASGCLHCRLYNAASVGVRVYNAVSMQNLQTRRSSMLVVYSSEYLLIVHSQPHTYTQVANSFLLYSQTFFSQSLLHLRFVRKNIQYLCWKTFQICAQKYLRFVQKTFEFIKFGKFVFIILNKFYFLCSSDWFER